MLLTLPRYNKHCKQILLKLGGSMMKCRKAIAAITAILMLGAMMTGCAASSESAEGNQGQESGSTETGATETPSGNFDSTMSITIVSREEGSGTRGAFVELFEVEEEIDGKKVDATTVEANITQSTSVVMSSVAGDLYAIGYISLGSLDSTVKAVKIDGVEASADNIKSGDYKISRPFNIATKDGISEVAQDFVDFILSTQGQNVVAQSGYISLEATEDYESKGLSGKVVVAGSSSVTPVMEKLKEAYNELNAEVEIEIQQSDSSTGMQSVIDDVCDIGMASREIKESELDGGLNGIIIAMDGIAIVVNKDNETEDMTKEQVQTIYLGEADTWEEAMR